MIAGIEQRMERVHLIIRGRVQGVFFRAHTIREAKRLGLTGFVRNRPDGTVEAVAEGPREGLEQFVAWCRRGPELAHVEDVEIAWEAARGTAHDFGLS